MKKKKAAKAKKKATPKYLTKVIKLEILRPEKWISTRTGLDDGELTWQEMKHHLWNLQKISAMFLNKMITELYLNFSMDVEREEYRSAAEVNKELRDELEKSPYFSSGDLRLYATDGALNAKMYGALDQNVLKPQFTGEHFKSILKLERSLATFKKTFPLYVRADTEGYPKVFLDEDGDHKLDLGVTVGKLMRIVLRTRKIDGSTRKILDRLVEGTSGYSQQLLMISHNERKRKWFVSCAFRYPVDQQVLDADVVCGVDIGYSSPVVVAVNNSDRKKIGRRDMAPLGDRIKDLRAWVERERRKKQISGRDEFVAETARGGHGRKRRLQATKSLQDKIKNARTTINHQISRAIVDFAVRNSAATIQVEDLSSLKESLIGSFLGEKWEIHQLQEFLRYKSKEKGIEVVEVDPQFSSRRCHRCGFINEGFTRKARDRHKAQAGELLMFSCPECELTDCDPDFNAAKNLAEKDIAEKIRRQCRKQKIEMHSR